MPLPLAQAVTGVFPGNAGARSINEDTTPGSFNTTITHKYPNPLILSEKLGGTDREGNRLAVPIPVTHCL